NLQMTRTIKGQRQWDLSRATGIHQSKISLIEHGYIIPNDKEKEAIADALGVSINEIDWSEASC
ncbi:MAG: helix-turn-helix transcriptional regulator, partial [Planctomycetota bacterium]